jgi:hypothetical protein
MGDDRLTSSKRGLGGKGFGDFLRQPAARCTRLAVECHHVVTTAPSTIENTQMLCKECHTATETHGVSSGLSPLPFSEEVKAAARVRCAGRCECTRAHVGHAYPIPIPPPRRTVSL